MDKPIATILVVDDNPTNLNLLFDVLDKAGFEVLVAQNGENALRRAMNTHPDLILLDVMMPGMNGFITCEHLKANDATRDIPVIFMTALSDTKNKIRGFDMGAVDFVTKPINPEEVLARVKTHLTIQQLQRDLQEKNHELSVSLDREKELHRLKSRFITMVSHEFKTPLTTMLLSCNLLKRYGERMTFEKQRDELDVIEKTIKHMNTLLEDVLTISRGDSGKLRFSPKPNDVHAICAHLIEQFQALSEETHQVALVSSIDGKRFFVDQNLIEHILSNVLSNAMKYSPQGGQVTLECRHHADHLEFRVTDEGIGISAADQEHLFETFHRGENVKNIQGTGLGLSIVKQFVDIHGGNIAVVSELGRGTIFTVVIPAATAD